MLQINPDSLGIKEQLLAEIILNKTNKISKISENSVFSGIISGISNLSLKSDKDIAIFFSRLYPDFSYGKELDNLAKYFGLGERLGSSRSSVFLRLSGSPGTTYDKDINIFKSNSGISFKLENNQTIGSFGFIYAKAYSLETGINTNVDAISINQVNPIPIGHQSVVNESLAQGGRDIENDQNFRLRLKNIYSISSIGTLSALEQHFIKQNSDILRLINYGLNQESKLKIGVLTNSGRDLTDNEKQQLLDNCAKYLSLIDYRATNNGYSIELVNAGFTNIDVSFRCELQSGYNPDDIRRSIQIRISKYFDLTTWEYPQKVQWDDILVIVKTTSGIKYIDDNSFYPKVDITIDKGYFPRLRGFQMLTLKGEIISDSQGSLSPINYPQNIDFFYQSTILRNI